MKKLVTVLLFMIAQLLCSQESDQLITRQGTVSFFSYTTVENIEANNNQVLSIIDIDKKEIAVSMLMRTFVFKKKLMREHFNESYIESDRYPKATFEGTIEDFVTDMQGAQTKIIRGALTLHGVTKDTEIKSKIEKTETGYVLSGEFKAVVKDFEIKIPPVLAGNIAEIITITFRFEYEPYEK
ncbi:YceI family protein [Aquimarina sp. SS2-1]|uniref:YceI family protein n=1 Tax=Aquimarina besae TaxID=3342247 RepID=UPI00366BC0CA